jgi:hypothetical protein
VLGAYGSNMSFSLTADELIVQAHYEFCKPLDELSRSALAYNHARWRRQEKLAEAAEAKRIAEVASELSERLPDEMLEQVAGQVKSATDGAETAARVLRSCTDILCDAAGDHIHDLLEVIDRLHTEKALTHANIVSALRARIDGQSSAFDTAGGELAGTA